MPDFDYVVVGSGAGGGTVAARLAEEGRTVLVLEAGGDPRTLQGGNALRNENSLPDDYDVPAFHPFSTENKAVAWDYFVRHYANDAAQRGDPKCCPRDGQDPIQGILYPRAGTLGGCTAHNAQILVYPDNADWNAIAEATGDPTWRAEAMRAIFQKLERCRHRIGGDLVGTLAGSLHGFDGWLQTEKAIPGDALRDEHLVRLVEACGIRAAAHVGSAFGAVANLLEGHADPNDWHRVSAAREGIFYAPLTTANHRRIGTRERLLDVAQRFPDRLTIELDAHATQVVIEGGRATGVSYLKGSRLYRAFKEPSDATGVPQFVRASREVILAGGAFNTPQLLMLSGIGPEEHLRDHGIDVEVALDGVGKNLQDRYEVGMVYDVGAEWSLLQGAQFGSGDPQYESWKRGKGVYTSNGALLAVIKKSFPDRPVPDLFCFALIGEFGGYAPDYSAALLRHDRLTWAVLKGHTNNRGGEVRLRSRDPLDTPLIDFHYFDEGSPGWQADLDSVVAGIKFVRHVMDASAREGLVRSEMAPGADAQSDDDLRQFVRRNAWGHHASCTCPIGAKEHGGVVDSSFRVHGVQGLRVVDASVFPRIPGLFVVSSVYMIGEKAAQAILHG